MSLEAEKEAFAKVTDYMHAYFVIDLNSFLSLGAVQFSLQRLLLTYLPLNKIAVWIPNPVSVLKTLLYLSRNMWMVSVYARTWVNITHTMTFKVA